MRPIMRSADGIFWILACALHEAGDAIAAADSTRQPTYCFEPSDVAVRQIGAWQSILVIDNFFCDGTLNMFDQILRASNELGYATTSPETLQDFQGWRVPLGMFEQSRAKFKRLGKKMGLTGSSKLAQLGRLLSGQYINKIVEVAVFAGFHLHPGTPFASDVKEVRDLNHNRLAGVLSMMTEKPRTSIHVDAAAVVNVHLSRDYNDTGTVYFTTRDGQESCTGDAASLRACRDAIDSQNVFYMLQNERIKNRKGAACKDEGKSCSKLAARGDCWKKPEKMYKSCPSSCGVCAGLFEGAHAPAGMDHAGLFKRVHMEPFRLNRVTLYSGHLFHSAYFSKESVARMSSSDPYGGRLLMQHFINAADMLKIVERYAEVDGIQAFGQRIMADETGLKPSPVTRRLLMDMVDAEQVPESWAAAIGGRSEL